MDVVHNHPWADVPTVPPALLGHAPTCAPSFHSRQDRHLDSFRHCLVLVDVAIILPENRPLPPTRRRSYNGLLGDQTLLQYLLARVDIAELIS
jgi:hypothetical protein